MKERMFLIRFVALDEPVAHLQRIGADGLAQIRATDAAEAKRAFKAQTPNAFVEAVVPA